MIVYVCRGISDRHLETIVAAGATTVDQVTLLEEILTSEEGHINWIEAQLELIKQAGEGNYLAQQIKESDA
jgi:bacterioferritin (cytochrome b1)